MAAMSGRRGGRISRSPLASACAGARRWGRSASISRTASMPGSAAGTARFRRARPVRRTRRLLLLLLALFALLLLWLLATSSGLRFLIARALPDDGSMRIASVQGSLWSGVHAQGIDLVLPGMRVQVRELRAGLALAPLWRGAARLSSGRGARRAGRSADGAGRRGIVRGRACRICGIEQIPARTTCGVTRADARWRSRASMRASPCTAAVWPSIRSS